MWETGFTFSQLHNFGFGTSPTNSFTLKKDRNELTDFKLACCQPLVNSVHLKYPSELYKKQVQITTSISLTWLTTLQHNVIFKSRYKPLIVWHQPLSYNCIFKSLLRRGLWLWLWLLACLYPCLLFQMYHTYGLHSNLLPLYPNPRA